MKLKHIAIIGVLTIYAIGVFVMLWVVWLGMQKDADWRYPF